MEDPVVSTYKIASFEELLPRTTGNYPGYSRPFQSPFRLKIRAALSRYALSQRGTEKKIFRLLCNLQYEPLF